MCEYHLVLFGTVKGGPGGRSFDDFRQELFISGVFQLLGNQKIEYYKHNHKYIYIVDISR